MYSFSILEPVCCSMSSSNCRFLTCIQITQEAGQVVWYSHLLKNFPQFVVIYSVSGFGVINKAEVNVFLELSCFLYDPAHVDNLISDSSAFSKSSLNIMEVLRLVEAWLREFWALLCLVCEMSAIWTFFVIAVLWDLNENWPFPVLWPLLSFPK